MKLYSMKAVLALFSLTLGFSQAIFASPPSRYMDSTQVRPHPSSSVKPMKYQSYVDTTPANCVVTDKQVRAVALGVGYGNEDHACPKDYPVMTQWNQTTYSTTGLPWTGAVMGFGGDSRVLCCAVKHKWST